MGKDSSIIGFRRDNFSKFYKQQQVVQNQMKGQNLRMEFVKYEKYSPWHDIESMTESEHYVNAVIEIPKGTLEKFEVSTKEEWNSIKPDLKDGQIRKLRYNGAGDELDIFQFDGMPHAYGMIPKTFEDPMHTEKVQVHVIGEHLTKEVVVGGDQDPLDLFILADRPLPIGQCKCKIIGVYHFVDGDEIDYKIIAVDCAYTEIDSINEISDLCKHQEFQNAPREILNWLKFYKTVDNDGVRIANHEKKLGKVLSGRPTDSAEARKVVKECR